MNCNSTNIKGIYIYMCVYKMNDKNHVMLLLFALPTVYTRHLFNVVDPMCTTNHKNF